MSTGNWTRSLDETLHRLQMLNGYSNRVLETKVCLTCGEVVDRIGEYKAEMIASNFVDRIRRQFEAEDAERSRRAELAKELFSKATAIPQIQ